MISDLMRRGEITMKAFLLMFEGDVKSRLSGARTGRHYIVSKTGPAHIASAPGESPARLHGHLANSIGHSGPFWKSKNELIGEVGSGLGIGVNDPSNNASSYARRLEFGGVHIVPRTVPVRIHTGEWRMVKAGTQIRILPRPYMGPSAEKMRVVAEKMFDQRV
ncbi:MAG: hypothetical protein WDA12_05015 [Bacilli bacterium]